MTKSIRWKVERIGCDRDCLADKDEDEDEDEDARVEANEGLFDGW